jgi:hypothetical protein
VRSQPSKAHRKPDKIFGALLAISGLKAARSEIGTLVSAAVRKLVGRVVSTQLGRVVIAARHFSSEHNYIGKQPIVTPMSRRSCQA